MTLTSAQRRTATWIALSLLLLLALWLLAPVLTPFVIAVVLGYVLHPAVERLAGRRVPRWIAVALVEVAAIVAALAVLLLIVPILSKQLPLLREQITLLADRLNTSVGPWLAKMGMNVALDTESIKAFVLKYLDANLEDWIATASRMLPPRMRDSVHGFANECDAVLGQYLRGQLLVMLVLAAYYSVGLTLFGFDLAVPVGVFTGLAVFIPYVGFGLGLTLALISGALQFAGWHGLIGVAVVYGIGQVIESFLLTPQLVGERIGMSPITVIFALLAFGHLFGFVGVLVALPLSALLVVAVRRVRETYLGSRLFLG